MEAGDIPLPAVGLWPRKAGHSPGLKARDPRAPGADEINFSAQIIRQEGQYSSNYVLFYSYLRWIGWCPPDWGGQITLLSPPIQKLIWYVNTITNVPRNNV